MEETNFDRLLHRYLHNQLSEQEKQKFLAWLDVLHKENHTDLELSTEDQEKLFQKITSNIDSVDDVIALYPRRSGIVKLFSKRWVQIAASVIVIVSLSLGVWDIMRDNSPQQSVASSSIDKIILNDGTIVWLQEDSKFVYYEKDGERHAKLTGEGLFEVAKIPDRPFTIACGDINVKVVGTSFSLKTGQEHIELSVLTGKVNLTSTIDNIGVDVEPKEKIIYTTKGKIERKIITGSEVSAIIKNTGYDMAFRSAPMERVIECIARKFDVTVTVENDSLRSCHISVDLTDKSLESTLQLLTELIDVSYTINGQHVELSGKGC